MSERCILYVEDDPNDVFLLRTAFDEAGITVPLHTVHDGQEAIDYLRGQGKFVCRKTHPLPCVVLLDLKIPARSGLEVLQWIRKQDGLKGMVVIMFTSSHHAMDVERAYELGVNSFIVKPMGIAERLELAQLFKGWWLRFNMFPLMSSASPGTQSPGSVHEPSWGFDINI